MATMLKSKELTQRKAKLEADARAKLAEITEGVSADQARAIEADHKALMDEIAELDKQIRAAKKRGDEEEAEGAEGKGIPKRKRRAKKEDEDDDESEEEEEEDDEDEDYKDKRKGRALPMSYVREMMLLDSQVRGLGIEDISITDAIEAQVQPDEIRKRIFDSLAKRSAGRGPGTSVSPGPNGVTILRDEREGVAQAMEVALITRILASRGKDGIEYKPLDIQERARVEKYREQAKEYLSLGLVDIAAKCINYRGRGSYLTAREIDDIYTRAFQSTSDFPNIFQNVLNKSLLARYELAMPTYRRIAAQRNFNDFRPHPQIRAGEFPALQPINETGEIQYGTTGDLSETVSVKPYGVVFTISRVMLVNDDLSAIDQILGTAGDAVLIFENTTFFQTFLSNAEAGPTLNQDSTAVFAAGHNNLAASGTDITVTSIGAARQSLRQMKSIAGYFLNIPPRILLTGPVKETAADQIVASITPTLTTSVNPFSGRLESVSDPNITDTSWYVCAEAARLPCFIYGFLNGSAGPRTRTFEPFGVQGVKISLEHDFGCGAIDYRGMYRNPGA
jgi:hypothetical protein